MVAVCDSSVQTVQVALCDSPDYLPTRYGSVRPSFRGVKPLLDVGLINVVEVTIESLSGEGGQISSTIDEKLSAGEIVFPGETVQKHSSWIGASPSKSATSRTSFVSRGIALNIQDSGPLFLTVILSIATLDGCVIRRTLRVLLSWRVSQE